MLELTTTRTNEMIDPHMHVWGWEIPVYLFFGGLVAGMMIISGFFLFMQRYREKNCACFLLPGLSLIFLSVGMGALFLDLEHKLFVWRLYTTFEVSSPMSWGSWILILVYPALVANLFLRLPGPIASRLPKAAAISERLLDHPVGVQTIGAINIGLGAALGIYTGILLSALGARPLWNSALLGPLFLVSGLSTAAAFVHMVARDRAEREMLAKADNGFLVVELALIGLFLIGLLTASHSHVEAARLFLGGPYTAIFWVFVVALGILVPLFVQSLAVNHKIQHTPIAPILVIAGGLALRFVMVSAGQISHWSSWIAGS